MVRTNGVPHGVGADVAGDLILPARASPDRPVSLLTPRQCEVVVLVARGHTNQQIADELVLAPGTVANHVEQILNRLGLESRAQATAWAIEHGLTTTQDRLLTTLERLLEIETLTIGATMDRVATLLAEALGTENVDAFLHEARTDTLVAVGTSDTPVARKQRAAGLDRQPIANGGRAVMVFQTGKPFRTGRADQDAEELKGVVGTLGIRSEIGVPLDVAGERRGALLAQTSRVDAFSDRDLRFLQAVTRWVGSVVHRAELTEQVTATTAEQARRAATEELARVVAQDLRAYFSPLPAQAELVRRHAIQADSQAGTRDADELLRLLERLGHAITALADTSDQLSAIS